jgi:hypothetical protein
VVVTQVKPVWSVGTEKLFIAGNTSEIKVLKNAHRNSNNSSSSSSSSTASAPESNNTFGAAQLQSGGGRDHKLDISTDLSAMLHQSAPSAAVQLLYLSSDYVDTSREGRAMESMAAMAAQESAMRGVGGREGSGCSPYTPSLRYSHNSTTTSVLKPVTSPVPMKEEGLTDCRVEGLSDAGRSAVAAPHTHTPIPASPPLRNARAHGFLMKSSAVPKLAVKSASGENALDQTAVSTGDGDGDCFVYCPTSDLRKRVNYADTDPFPFCSSSASTFSPSFRSSRSSVLAKNQSDIDSEIVAKMEISFSCTIISWIDGTTGEEKSFELEEENEKQRQRVSDIKLDLEKQESRTSKPRVSFDGRRSSFSTSTSVSRPNASATNKRSKSSLTGGAERREVKDFSSVSCLSIHCVNEESRMGIILEYKVHTVLLPHLIATWLAPGREIEIFCCLVSEVDVSKDLMRVSRSDHTIVKVKGEGDGKREGSGERVSGVDERRMKRSVSVLVGHGHGHGSVNRLSATRPYSGIRRRSSLGVSVSVTSSDGNGLCGKRDSSSLLDGGDTVQNDACIGGDDSVDKEHENKLKCELSAVTTVRRNNIIENEKNRYRALCQNEMEFRDVSTHLKESCARYRINNVNVRILAGQGHEQYVEGAPLNPLKNRSELDKESKIEERQTTNTYTVLSSLEWEGPEGMCPSLPVKRARIQSPGPGRAHSTACDGTTGTDSGCVRQAQERNESSHGWSCSALVLVMVSKALRAERMYIDRDSLPQLLSHRTSASTLRCDIVFARVSDPDSASGLKNSLPRIFDDNQYSNRALDEKNLDDVISHWRIVWINVRN